MNRGNLAKSYLIEKRLLIQSSAARVMEKKGELKLRLKFPKLMKTNGEKMSVFRLSTMLMKTNELNHPLHDVDEKKGVSRWARRKHSGSSLHDSRGTQSEPADWRLWTPVRIRITMLSKDSGEKQRPSF